MHVKIFGERNTGTNFLNQLLRKNTDLKLLNHGSNNTARKRKDTLLRNINKYMGEKSENGVRISKATNILDRLIDQQRKDEYTLNYGWKHSAIEYEKLKTNDLYNETIFICLIRNPWRFVSSLHRRPYNLYPKVKCDLVEFIKMPFLANERDGIKDIYLSNPVDLWNQKVESYFEVAKKSDRIMICYYEDIMINMPEFMERLRPYCKISNKIEIPINSTKGDAKTFDDYKKETQSYNPKKDLGEEVYDLIRRRLKEDVLSMTIYK